MREAHLNGTTIHYRRAGSGPVALFIHGFPLDWSMWEAQVADLADARTCIAPDLRGFGRSRGVVADLLTMEQHALDLVALLDEVGAKKADIVGLSMGGYVAFAMWALHPERFESLSLIDTRANADDEAGKANRDASAARLVEIGRAAWAREMIGNLVAPDANVEVRAQLLDMIESTSHRTIVGALEAMKNRPDHLELLPAITAPTLVVVGENDTLTPPNLSRAIAEAIPGARLEIIPGSGHMSPMEKPAEVNAALRRFLGG